MSKEELKKKIKRLCYGPFRDGQSPITKIYPIQKQILEDLHLIKKNLSRVRMIRTYSTYDNFGKIPVLAKKVGIDCLPGCALDQGPWMAKKEFTNLLKITQKGLAEMVVIGDMALFRRQMTFDELVSYIKKGKIVAKVPVGTGNHWQEWLKHPHLVNEVDFLCVGIYPYEEGVSVGKAINYLSRVLKKIEEINPQKKRILIDSGWPSAGVPKGEAIFSPKNQALYIRKFIDYCERHNLEYFIFEVFDENWKKIYEKARSTHFGIFTAERKLKFF